MGADERTMISITSMSTITKSRFILIGIFIGASISSSLILPDYLKLASLLFLFTIFTQVKPLWDELHIKEHQ